MKCLLSFHTHTRSDWKERALTQTHKQIYRKVGQLSKGDLIFSPSLCVCLSAYVCVYFCSRRTLHIGVATATRHEIVSFSCEREDDKSSRTARWLAQRLARAAWLASVHFCAYQLTRFIMSFERIKIKRRGFVSFWTFSDLISAREEQNSDSHPGDTLPFVRCTLWIPSHIRTDDHDRWCGSVLFVSHHLSLSRHEFVSISFIWQLPLVVASRQQSCSSTWRTEIPACGIWRSRRPNPSPAVEKSGC